MQIGVKEVGNRGWKNYLKHFSNIKIIITGRDPRDLYISVYYWENKGRPKPKPLSTRRLAFLRNNIERQADIFKTGQAIKVKYEDLCCNPEETIYEMKKFINSPIPDIGEIGQFMGRAPKRKREYGLHGNSITTKHVNRWQEEPNKSLVKLANDFFDSVPDYCEFWGYK